MSTGVLSAIHRRIRFQRRRLLGFLPALVLSPLARGASETAAESVDEATQRILVRRPALAHFSKVAGHQLWLRGLPALRKPPVVRHFPWLAFSALLAIAAELVAPSAWAQPNEERPADPPSSSAPRSASDEGAQPIDSTPKLRRDWGLGDLAGRRITRIDLVTEGGRWEATAELKRIRVGEKLTGEVARRAMRELTDSGRYARVRAEASADGDGAVLTLVVLPRKIVTRVRLSGGSLDENETLQAMGVRVGSEVTAPGLEKIRRAIGEFYAKHGFPRARVEVQAIDTDDPTAIVLFVNIEPGPPLRFVARRFQATPRKVRGLAAALKSYDVKVGDRVDEEKLELADRELERRMQNRGWHRAQVEHRVAPHQGGAVLWVIARAGPLMRLVFEGNRHFDDANLEAALELEDADDRTPARLQERIRDFYVARGFLDAEIAVRERGGAKDAIHDLVFEIRPNSQVRVIAREFPCLRVDAPVSGKLKTKKRSADDVGSEIDSFLSEELPGSGILGLISPKSTDQALGPRVGTGARVAPLRLNPWNTYQRDVYERALEHVQGLYRSEGFLTATVGPVAVLRRRCHPRSPPGRCIPMGKRQRPQTSCYDPQGLPAADEGAPKELACQPDPAAGIRCEPEVVLHIPVRRGPQTELYDITFEGNRQQTERRLEEVAELELGEPVSQVALEAARRRLLDEYAEEGFAFAEVDVVLDISPDGTRARARFIISERERVIVSDVRVRGAVRTNDSLILRRVALEKGEPYRRSLVRKTEERLATLGVFSSIVVGLEDPYIPAREKVVVITVQERRVQRVELRPGLSTGEGVRVGFEYGHRNIFGEAIQLTATVRLSILPNFLILEDDVRRKLNELDDGDRIERRNRLGIEFPEIGLGPLIRLGVDGIDVRDIARDFALTKNALIVALIYRPTTRFSAQIGGSVERNDANIFGDDQTLEEFLRQSQNANLERLLRVPDGQTYAIAERIGFTWDRRDNPFDATRGTLLSADIEHVSAFPANNNPNTIESDFFRLTGRVAGYLRLHKNGLSLATSLRAGYNIQTRSDSKTYPDRLHFLGGVDTIRGFPQDSVVPQDVAEEILNPDPVSPLTIDEVAIRGGDVSLNPRTELRIPIVGIYSTALFVDAGNLWVDPQNIEPFNLRYAAGSGLRVGTPIGPIAFDYGINLKRRPWEDFGAFHFSISLF